MVPQFQTLEKLIEGFLKPGYQVSLMEDPMSANINVRFYNTNTRMFQVVRLTYEFIHRAKFDHIIDHLTTCTTALNLTPLYQRVFNQLMYDILWHQFKQGQIWD